MNTLGEPFYTTKEKGTGLGLMTSFKIIENHSGLVKVNSEVNKGTVFENILPKTQA
ncbi:ATP-binding protein [Sutcliffiella horikoshii]|uniref:ATP-binding protein n=1 Tax=Sutcliffiella horikoshii TaxID=79883 RepID=UPI003CEE84EB